MYTMIGAGYVLCHGIVVAGMHCSAWYVFMCFCGCAYVVCSNLVLYVF